MSQVESSGRSTAPRLEARFTRLERQLVELKWLGWAIFTGIAVLTGLTLVLL